MAFPVIAAAKTVIDVGINVKKFRDLCCETENTPEQIRLLWLMVDATVEPLRLCVDLAKRFHTQPLVENAVSLARYVIAECERSLARDDDSDDDMPKEGWKKWWSKKAEKVEIGNLCNRVSMSQQALQLALAAVAASALQRTSLCQPFRFIPDAMEAARTVVEEFEMGRVPGGRLLAAGCVFRNTPRSAAKSGQNPCVWEECGEKAVRLKWSDGHFSVCLEDAHQTSTVESPKSDSDVIVMQLQTLETIQRATARTLLFTDGLEADALAYRLGEHVLLFESVPTSSGPRDCSSVRISAEVLLLEPEQSLKSLLTQP
jgi:hypothetical protein